MKQYKVGVVGCTGMVGQRFVTLMENHPWFQLTVVAASARSAGKTYEEAVSPRWAMDTPIPEEAKKLVEVTEQSFFEGIKFAKPGYHLNDIGTAIQKYAESFGFGVVRDLVGHGIGTNMHEDPEIPNFAQKRKGIRLTPGMTLAIEPMITAGRYDVVWGDDGWTVTTEDGSLASHYENTILITDGEPEILSLQQR